VSLMRGGRPAASLPAMASPRSPRRLLLPACAAAALAAAVPGAAHAATITVDGAGTYTYTGAPGEINNISVQGSEDGSVTFNGPEAVLVTSAPAGCTPSPLYGMSVVTCAGPKAIVVNAADGDENLNISSTAPAGVPVTVDGGAGSDWINGDAANDTLVGGPGNDKLDGGRGDDTLDGGDGDDILLGKAGADRLLGGAGDDEVEPDSSEEPSADFVDGGPGTDRLESDYGSKSYNPPVTALSITPDAGADDGRPGEGDDLRSIERFTLHHGTRFVGTDAGEYVKEHQILASGDLAGNGGNDELIGADGTDKIDGGAGDDRLDGGFGDDTLIGGPGKDIISGDRAGGDCGPIWCKYPYGNDAIDARDGEMDSVTCGAGADTVLADAGDVVAPDCETVTRGAAVPAPGAVTPGAAKGNAGTAGPAAAPKLALAKNMTLATALRRGVTVKVTGAHDGTLKLVARRGTTVVARGSAKVRGGAATVTLRFTARAKRGLRHARRAVLKVSGGDVTATLTLARR
jgi:hypothetical protein